jgi:hypothetical protein
MWRKGWANSIPIYIQQNATLHSLFISGNCSTCFGWYFHPLSGVHTTVSTAFGICHTVTVICRCRGRVGTGLSVLWVAYATHSTLKPPTAPTVKLEAATAVVVAPDNGREDARNMLSCIWMTNNKLENLLYLVGWSSWKYDDARTCKP